MYKYKKNHTTSITTQTTALGTNVRYRTRFTSLISPYALPKSSLLLLRYAEGTSSEDLRPFPGKKILVKQSYMFTAWISYLQLTALHGSQQINLDDPRELEKLRLPKTSLVVLPKKDKITTHLRAPMAHKTFSQEQFIFRFYFLLSSFRTPLTSYDIPSSINQSIYILLTARKVPFIQGTNILETQSFAFTSVSSDKHFFNRNLLNKACI